MQNGRGKQFEGVLEKCFKNVKDVSIDRFKDPTMGYGGVKNVCDFVVYRYPYQYYVEAKAIKGNTLNFKSHITEYQLQELTAKSKIRGVSAGIVVWFIEHDQTYFIPIQSINELSKTEKSFNVKKLEDYNDRNLHFIALKGKKKRVFFDYNLSNLLDIINLSLEV